MSERVVNPVALKNVEINFPLLKRFQASLTLFQPQQRSLEAPEFPGNAFYSCLQALLMSFL